ncbi:hypothetical protein ABBQ32_013259 [Trebouxia sp. C0010 RCD-2024]
MAFATASQDHVVYCFDVLIHSFGDVQAPPAVLFAQAHCPLFVTWSKVSRFGDYRLRGCIGTLKPRHLHTALHDYALTSALQDKRFSPISHEELPHLSCTVSLLHSFEKASNWQDWEIGTHGLIIEFRDPNTHEHRSATYLPEIAAAEGWTKLSTIDSLIRKAGFTGHIGYRLKDGLTVTRYQSTAHMMTYKEYTAAVAAPIESMPAAANSPAVAVQA